MKGEMGDLEVIGNQSMKEGNIMDENMKEGKH
jgi:hypothetical protein